MKASAHALFYWHRLVSRRLRHRTAQCMASVFDMPLDEITLGGIQHHSQRIAFIIMAATITIYMKALFQPAAFVFGSGDGSVITSIVAHTMKYI